LHGKKKKKKKKKGKKEIEMAGVGSRAVAGFAESCDKRVCDTPTEQTPIEGNDANN